MPSNSFGSLFRITTFGEAHGPAIGCVIDGCPAGLCITREEIQEKLSRRAPGQLKHTSPRKEKDEVEILSGLFEGRTTGTPIALLIRNIDADPSAYESMKSLFRPGHANYTYLQKYGHFDWRGGGRASARETACRVAAGAIAEKLLLSEGIEIVAFLKGVGSFLSSAQVPKSVTSLFCASLDDEKKIEALLQETQEVGDSLGGQVECVAYPLLAGLGDPVYEKIEAKLASAMMSLPASKAFEIGTGVRASQMKGSEHNDAFYSEAGAAGERQIKLSSNHAGGTLGGITTGAPLVVRVHFKPASTIRLPQKTTDFEGNEVTFQPAAHSRHDPCVAIRAVPVVRAMMALVLADCLLLQKTARIGKG